MKAKTLKRLTESQYPQFTAKVAYSGRVSKDNHYSLFHHKMKTIAKFQVGMAIASFIAAVGFGTAGFIVPPEGQIHESVLYLIAQFMLLTASLFGVGAIFSSSRKNRENASTASPIQNTQVSNQNNP